MSSKKVIVLYNGTETLMDIEINEDNLYNSFLDIFRQRFNLIDPSLNKFKLTAINTNVPYLLIDPNNIASIIKEKIENNAPLKLLLTKEEGFEEIKRDSMDDNFFCGYMKGISLDDEDFYDDFITLDEHTDIEKIRNQINIDKNKEKEQEKKEEKKEEEINKMLTNSLNKINNNDNKNEIKKEDNNNNVIENENDLENLNLNDNLRLSNLDGNINIT